MLNTKRKITLEDSCLMKGSHPPEFSSDTAYFTSPVGIVRCHFSKEGRLIACSPLKGGNTGFVQKNWLSTSEQLHPTLAQAIRYCLPPPSPYETIMPIVNWAPDFWQVLTEVPLGSTCSYSELAERNGLHRNKARAIGNLLATNPIMILYPCHRIILANGQLGNYRWGEERKRALLKYEASITIHHNNPK